MNRGKVMHLYYSDIFDVSPKALDKYGAFNIYLVIDLPLFKKDSGPSKRTAGKRAGMTEEINQSNEKVV